MISGDCHPCTKEGLRQKNVQYIKKPKNQSKKKKPLPTTLPSMPKVTITFTFTFLPLIIEIVLCGDSHKVRGQPRQRDSITHKLWSYLKTRSLRNLPQLISSLNQPPLSFSDARFSRKERGPTHFFTLSQENITCWSVDVSKTKNLKPPPSLNLPHSRFSANLCSTTPLLKIVGPVS